MTPGLEATFVILRDNYGVDWSFFSDLEEHWIIKYSDIPLTKHVSETQPEVSAGVMAIRWSNLINNFFLFFFFFLFRCPGAASSASYLICLQRRTQWPLQRYTCQDNLFLQVDASAHAPWPKALLCTFPSSRLILPLCSAREAATNKFCWCPGRFPIISCIATGQEPCPVSSDANRCNWHALLNENSEEGESGRLFSGISESCECIVEALAKDFVDSVCEDLNRTWDFSALKPHLFERITRQL